MLEHDRKAESVHGQSIAEKKTSSKLKICTISDGVDSLIRLAAWIATLDEEVEREDLDMSQALSHLTGAKRDVYDIIVIAPAPGGGGSPVRRMQAVHDAAISCSSRQIILWPPGHRLAIRISSTSVVNYGPPFGKGDVGRSSKDFPRLQFPWRQKSSSVISSESPEPPPRVLAIQPMAGGAGATTLAVNLSVDLASRDLKKEILLLDLDIQGAGATLHLDVRSDQQIVDLYRNFSQVKLESFRECLVRSCSGLQVFPAPPEILPLDLLSGKLVSHILALARECADYVVLDLPCMMADWVGSAYLDSDMVLSVSRIDVRSASRCRRLRELVPSDVLPSEKLKIVANCRPQNGSAGWEEALKFFYKGVGIDSQKPPAVALADGGASVSYAADAGLPLKFFDPGNPFLDSLAILTEAIYPKSGKS